MTTDIHLFVFDGLSDWEIGYVTAGINTPDYQKAPGKYRIRTVAMSPGEVRTAGGLRLMPDMVLDDVNPANCRMLILPGGAAWNEGQNEDVPLKAKAVLEQGGLVAAICGAVLGLARIGVLDQRLHTGNSPEYLTQSGYAGADKYQNLSAVTDGPLTTAGAASPLEFAVHVFRDLDLYEPRTLEAWYGLFKTGKAEYFEALQAA